MNKDYYARYAVHERSHWWFTARESILRYLLEAKILANVEGGLRILNIGAATGRTTEWLASYGEVVTLEYDQECCDYLIQEKGIDAIQGSITELPFADASFDLVCAFDVIEHVADDMRGVSEMHRVLRDGGYCYITVPALMSLWSNHDVVNHHHRRYTRSGLMTVIRSKFSRIEKSSYFNFFLFPIIWAIRTVGRKNNKASTSSDFDAYSSSSIGNLFFEFVFGVERYILKYMDLPIGVSILAIVRKKN